MTEDRPILTYASGAADISTTDAGAAIFTFAPRPVVVLLVVIALLTLILVIVGGAQLAIFAFIGFQQGVEGNLGAAAAIFLGVAIATAIAIYGAYHLFRTVRHLIRYSGEQVVIEVSPLELRVRSPILWGDEVRTWPRQSLEYARLVSAGRSSNLAKAFRLEIRERGAKSTQIIYFTTADPRMTDDLSALLVPPVGATFASP